MAGLAFKQLAKDGIYHNLPPRSTKFIGRAVELGQVLERVGTSRWPLVVIEGRGGIGKTSLALEVAYRCLPDQGLEMPKPFEAVVWISARDYADFNLRLDPLLDTIARVLHYPHVAQLPPGQKAGAVNKLLWRHRTLVVADNLETVTDLALIKFLEQIPEPSTALATTRYKQLRRAWNIFLYGLKEHETINLIRRHSQRIGLSGVAGVDEAILQRLAVAVGHNPKAVELSVGLIKQKGLPFNTQVDELYQASQVVKEMADYLLAEAWKSLDNETRQVLLAMSLFVSSASRATLAGVAKVEEVDQAIEQLVGMSLLEAAEAGDVNQQRYSLHPLIQSFAGHKLGLDSSLHLRRGHGEALPEKNSELKANFCAFFAKKTGASSWDFACWNVEHSAEIQLELPNLLIGLEWAYENKNWTQVLVLAKAIVHSISYQGYPDQRLRVSEYGLTAAKKLAMLEDIVRFSIYGLSFSYWLRGDYPKAEKYFSQGLQLAKDIATLP
jgi:LuxR family glucitol operon transcriptional activator